MVTVRQTVAFTLYIGLVLTIMAGMGKTIRGQLATPGGQAMAALTIFSLLILFSLGFSVVFYKFFICADFMPDSDIRFTKGYLKWLGAKLRGENRLARMPRNSITIPAPYGDESQRDPELEDLIRRKNLQAADERIQEQMEFYRLKGGESAEHRFNAYTQYMHFMIDFRRELEKP